MLIPGYRYAARLVHRLPLGRGKLAQSIMGRREAVERWENWSSLQRTDSPLVWVHAASVGEALTAEPIIRRLRTARPGIQIAHSFSSPSACHWPGRFGADASDYVPLDEPASVRRVMAALQPSLLLFSRGDVWPELVTQAVGLDVPVAVCGALIRPTSARLRQPITALLRQLYGSIHWCGVISHADADRYRRLGVPPAAIAVTGDPRHDQVLERVPRLQPLQSLLEWLQKANVLVAGSSHPEDESIILDAFCTVSRSDPAARLIVAPHDPNPQAMERVLVAGRRRGLAAATWDGVGPAHAGRCLVMAASGLLADLYAAADIAYVGGGFKRGELHATAEPAAYAVPVIVGPHYDNAADAMTLVERGGAVALPRRHAAERLAQVWLEWIRHPDRRITTGLAARRTIQQGAAARTVAAILPLIPTPDPAVK